MSKLCGMHCCSIIIIVILRVYTIEIELSSGNNFLKAMARTCTSHLIFYFAVVIRLLMVLLPFICQGTADAGKINAYYVCR